MLLTSQENRMIANKRGEIFPSGLIELKVLAVQLSLTAAVSKIPVKKSTL